MGEADAWVGAGRQWRYATAPANESKFEHAVSYVGVLEPTGRLTFQ